MNPKKPTLFQKIRRAMLAKENYVFSQALRVNKAGYLYTSSMNYSLPAMKAEDRLVAKGRLLDVQARGKHSGGRVVCVGGVAKFNARKLQCNGSTNGEWLDRL